MPYLKININGIINSNSTLPPLINRITDIKKGVGLLQNSIDSGVQNRMDINANIRNIYASLEMIESRVDTLYKGINSYMQQYSQTEDGIKQQTQLLINQADKIKHGYNPDVNGARHQDGTSAFQEELPIANPDILDNSKITAEDIQIVSYVNNPNNFYGFLKYNYFADFMRDRNTIADTLLIFAGDTLGVINEKIKGKTYREKVIEDSVGEILMNMSRIKIDSEAIPAEAQDIVKLLKQGKDLSDIDLGKKIKNSKAYKDIGKYKPLFEVLDKLDTVIDWGNFTAEQIELLIADYTASLDYLNSLKTALSTSGNYDKDLEKVVDNLIVTYTYKWLGTVRNLSNKICDDLYDGAIASGADFLTGGLYSLINLGKDLVMDYTNLGEKSDNLLSLYALENYKNKITSSYDYYADKIRSGDYTEEDIDQCRQMFDLSKAAVLKEYNLMYEISDDKKEKEFLKSEIDKIQSNSYKPIAFKDSVTFNGGGSRFSGGNGF